MLNRSVYKEERCTAKSVQNRFKWCILSRVAEGFVLLTYTSRHTACFASNEVKYPTCRIKINPCASSKIVVETCFYLDELLEYNGLSVSKACMFSSSPPIKITIVAVKLHILGCEVTVSYKNWSFSNVLNIIINNAWVLNSNKISFVNNSIL